jgi:hypothetical protein
MKVKVVMTAMVVLMLATLVWAQTTAAPSTDDYMATAAFEAATARWPGGFVQAVRMPATDYWTFEVGRVEIFGRKLVLGRGGSWAAAFADADAQAAKGVALPFGGGK